MIPGTAPGCCPETEKLEKKLCGGRVGDHQSEVVPNDDSLTKMEPLDERCSRCAAVDISKPSVGVFGSPITGRSGAITVKFSASRDTKGLHMREVSA